MIWLGRRDRDLKKLKGKEGIGRRRISLRVYWVVGVGWYRLYRRFQILVSSLTVPIIDRLTENQFNRSIISLKLGLDIQWIELIGIKSDPI